MDLNASIDYNSFSINTATARSGGLAASGFRVERLDIQNVPATGFVEKRALQDGMDAGDIYLQGRTIQAIVGVYGSTKGDFWDKAQTFLAAFNPRLNLATSTATLGFLPLNFYQPTADISTWPTSTYPNGIPMRFYCRPTAEPTYSAERVSNDGVSGKGLMAQFSVTLLAKDPRKYLQTTQTITLSTATQTATHRGDFPTYPVVTVTISGTGSSSYGLNLKTAGVNNGIGISFASTSSGVYTLDLAERTLVDANGTSFASYYLADPNFGDIQPGSTTLVYITGSTTNTSGVLTYREAWS